MRNVFLALSGAMSFTLPAMAQTMVDIPIWSNGILGQQAMRSTFDNYDKTHGIDKKKQPAAGSTTCSADALPATERRRMETEYVRRAKADGKASADAWVREQGMRFRQQLVEKGVCSKPESRTAARR